MFRFVKHLLIVLVLVALPVHGFAAAAMQMCAHSHAHQLERVSLQRAYSGPVLHANAADRVVLTKKTFDLQHDRIEPHGFHKRECGGCTMGCVLAAPTDLALPRFDADAVADKVEARNEVFRTRFEPTPDKPPRSVPG